MPRSTVNGVSLAVGEWPGKGPAIVCIHGLTAPKTNHYTVLMGQNPKAKAALRAFLNAR